MDSRKILEIYKRINDRSIRHVSAFPSIDAIPPGMVVLDSDGVMKQKVGDFLIPVPVTIIGSGPLPADASAYPVGALWVDEENVLWTSNGSSWVPVDASNIETWLDGLANTWYNGLANTWK